MRDPELETVNATIVGAMIDTEIGLTVNVTLDYGGTRQGFGGYVLYSEASWNSGNNTRNYAGRWIERCIHIAGCHTWDQLIGRTVRVKREAGTMGQIRGIGHITKDIWFIPKEDFADEQGKT